MNFLYPGFLFALLAIAVPIVIHLFNFRKFKRVYFSNVQFLKEAKEQNSSREKLKNLLVLISRILAIAFLVLAFSRPFIPSGPGSSPALKNMVSIYIDNSYSMETVNKEGSLLDEAKRKAKALAAAYGPADRFQLVTNDFEGRHQRPVGREEFIGLLDEVRISAAGRNLMQVINRMQSDANTGRSQVNYFLSDFQKSFTGTAPVQLEKSINYNKDISYNFIKLNANSLPNISVDSVWSLSPVHKPGGTEHMVLRLKNYGEEDAPSVPVKLSVNNQQKAISNVAVGAGKTVLDTMSFSGLAAGWQKAAVLIKDFPLTFDDGLNFTFQVSEQMKVLYINGNPADHFVSALFGADPYFKLTEMQESNISYSALPAYSLIVVNGLKNPSTGLAQELKAFAGNGGTVVIFPDLGVDKALYNPFLTGLQLPAIQQVNSGAPLATTIDLKNELFKDVFDQIPRNMDLPVVSRYFSFADHNRNARESILQLPLNRSLFALYPVGAGRVYLSASSLDLKDNNLPKHPLFVPLMYKIALGSAREQPLFYVTGENTLLESARISLLANQSLRLVSGDFEVIPEVRQVPGKTQLYVADQVRKPGFYALKKGDSTLAVMAFNDNRSESDMHYASEAELEHLFGNKKISVFNSRKDAMSLNIAAKNNSTELWKLCIILSVVFLAMEILLIRFFNKAKPS